MTFERAGGMPAYKLAQEIEWLASFKVERTAIPDRLGMTPQQIKLELCRHGYRDVWDRYLAAPPPEAASWWNWHLNSSRRPRSMQPST